MSYVSRMGWGGRHTYQEQIVLLYMLTNDNGQLIGWKMYSNGNMVEGEGKDSMVNTIQSLPKTTLVYVKNLEQVRAFLYDDIHKDHGISIDWGSNIEFRPWKLFTDEDEVNVMMDWQNLFNEDKFPYLTPSQYTRKQIAKTQAGKAKDLLPEDHVDLECIYKAVQPGVLYCRDDEIHENVIGLDLSSAYIYSLVFCKHACSAPKDTNPNDWELYLNAEDRASIGCYKITYKCFFSIIHCFKDINGQSLDKGKHTVEIMLSNIDLQLLMTIPQFQIESIECELLYTFKMDYLPEDIRIFCIQQYLIKCGLTRETAAYIRQKVILNSVYGNMLYDAGKILNSDNPKRELWLRAKNASVCPQWGIFTMSYTKQSVVEFGIKAAGYLYSDTDSVYCFDDTANRRLCDEFNQKIMSQNYALCEKFGYDKIGNVDLICKLGTFKVDSECKRFRAWGYKTYAYEKQPYYDENGKLIKGKVVVKAAGCNKKDAETDAKIVFSEDFKPSKGTVTKVDSHKDYYVERQTYDYIIDAMMKK